MNDEDDPVPGYDLLVPFICCQSVGGEYEDRSFVAGVRYADIRTTLSDRPEQFILYVEPAIIPQLDLLAMELGFTLHQEPWDEYPDEWTMVTFDLIKATAP